MTKPIIKIVGNYNREMQAKLKDNTESVEDWWIREIKKSNQEFIKYFEGK